MRRVHCGLPATDPNRPSGKRPYILHVLPLSTIDGLCGARALVLIIDPEEEPQPPRELIRRLFSLTNAEADVALRMLRGDGINPISDDLKLSVASVKTAYTTSSRKPTPTGKRN